MLNIHKISKFKVNYFRIEFTSVGNEKVKVCKNGHEPEDNTCILKSMSNGSAEFVKCLLNCSFRSLDTPISCGQTAIIKLLHGLAKFKLMRYKNNFPEENNEFVSLCEINVNDYGITFYPNTVPETFVVILRCTQNRKLVSISRS